MFFYDSIWGAIKHILLLIVIRTSTRGLETERCKRGCAIATSFVFV